MAMLAQQGKRPAALGTTLVVLCLLLAGAGPFEARASSPQADASVIGGRAASIAELPWVVAIETEEFEAPSTCTGTVVAPRIVLTAGHCVADLETAGIYLPIRFRVWAGISSFREAGKLKPARVSEVIPYPRFKPFALRGDVALLVLSAPLNAPALPLAGAADAALIEPGSPAVVAGYGAKTVGASDSNEHLRLTETAVEAPGSCANKLAFLELRLEPATQLCAHKPPPAPGSACHGDSGGPLIGARADGAPVQIGVVSLGDPACRLRFPNVFTRADAIAPWVAAWIAAVEHGAPRPQVVVPKRVMPKLSIARAKLYVTEVLLVTLEERFARGTGTRMTCQRVRREKVRCRVTWQRGPDRYLGTIAVFRAFHRDFLIPRFRGRVSRVNAACWDSGERGSCPVHPVV